MGRHWGPGSEKIMFAKNWIFAKFQKIGILAYFMFPGSRDHARSTWHAEIPPGTHPQMFSSNYWFLFVFEIIWFMQKCVKYLFNEFESIEVIYQNYQSSLHNDMFATLSKLFWIMWILRQWTKILKHDLKTLSHLTSMFSLLSEGEVLRSIIC